MLGFVPVFAQAATLTMADTSDATVRFDRLEDETHWDAGTTPSATLNLDTPRAAYSLRYAPNFSLLYIGEESTVDPDTGAQTLGQEWAIYHNLSASATLRFRKTSVTLSEQFTYGERNYRFDVAPVVDAPGDTPVEPEDGEPIPGGPGQTPVGQQGAEDVVVTLGSSTSTLGLGHRLAPRVNLSEYVSYSTSVPMDKQSRPFYPLQRSATTGVGFGYELTRRDTLTTSLEGSLFYTEPDDDLKVRSAIVQLREDWTREWSRQFVLTLGVGATYARTDRGDQTIEVLTADFGPSGTAGVEYNWGHGGAHYTLSGSFGSTPVVDRFTGIVDPRFFVGASLSRSQDRLTLTLAATGAQSADPDGEAPLASFGASFTAFYEVTQNLYLRLGGSTSTSDTPLDFSERPEAPTQYTAFVGLTYTLQPIRL